MKPQSFCQPMNAVVLLIVAFGCFCATARAGDVAATPPSVSSPPWRVGDWWLVGESKTAASPDRGGWPAPSTSYYEVVATCQLDGIPCVVLEKWPSPQDESVPEVHTVYYLRESDKAVVREVQHYYVQGELQPPYRTDFPAIENAPSYGSIVLPFFRAGKSDVTAPPAASDIVFDGRGHYLSQQVKVMPLSEVQDKLGDLNGIKSAIVVPPVQGGLEVVIVEGMEQERIQGDVSSVSQVWEDGVPWFLYEEQKAGDEVCLIRWLAGYGDASDLPAGVALPPSEKLDLSPLSRGLATAEATVISLAEKVDAQVLQNDVPVQNLSATIHTQRHFVISVPADQSQLEIRTWGGGGDSDMYVKYGAPASPLDADYRPYAEGNDESLTINNPRAGDWYIMLDADNSYWGLMLKARYSETWKVDGPSAQGNIWPAGDEDWWQFTVGSPGTYTIETWAGTLSDNYMYLYGPNSQTILIAEDDDSGEGSAAKIVQSLMPGTYYVRIRAYSPSGTGTYMIRVTGGGGGSAITTLLVNGSSAKGDISPAGDEDWYQFTASSWGTYTIETWAGTLTDNYMYLYGPNNQKTLIAEDDDSGEGRAAKIVRSLSPGAYYVKVRAYSSADTGTYSIRVTTDGGGGGPIITPLTVNGRGEEGNIEKVGEEDWYEFTVSSSGLYTVATWGLSLRDTYMYLYGPDNQKALITEDDDGGQGVAARILHWLSRGTYFVKVVGHAHVGVSDGTGTYWIQVTDDANHHMAALTVNGPIVTGSVSQVGHADWYQFTASSAGTYTIETWPGTLLDNHMHLYGPNSQTAQIAEDDDSGTGDAAKIVRSLSPGTYYVEVWAYSVADTGTYTIRVTK